MEYIVTNLQLRAVCLFTTVTNLTQHRQKQRVILKTHDMIDHLLVLSTFNTIHQDNKLSMYHKRKQNKNDK